MDDRKLLNLLNHAQGKDWTVSFADGDTYHVRSLDVHSDVLDPDGEISVDFCDCLNKSIAQQDARESPRRKVPNIWYAEKGRGAPVGKTYRVGEIASVFDNERNYYILEPTDDTESTDTPRRETPPRP